MDIFLKPLKEFLKKFPLLVKIKRLVWSNVSLSRGVTRHNILVAFPSFIPYSAGSYSEKSALTIKSINRTFPRLSSLLSSLNDLRFIEKNIMEFSEGESERESVLRLKKVLDAYGSDKATLHNYHHLYGAILSNSDDVKLVFEVGLGTNNTDVVSNMGVSGRPGASLRAFREFLPNAIIYGADIDKRVLFEEERIKTFFVDQTDPKSFQVLHDKLPNEFDLVIDDGLHSPDANIETLKFGLQKVKVGGWVVIEDIGREARPIWEVVSGLLPKIYESYLIMADGGTLVFAVRKLA